jgi:hypothetical protein
MVSTQGGVEIPPQLLVGLALAAVDVDSDHAQRFAVRPSLDHQAAGFKPGEAAVPAATDGGTGASGVMSINGSAIRPDWLASMREERGLGHRSWAFQC